VKTRDYLIALAVDANFTDFITKGSDYGRELQYEAPTKQLVCIISLTISWLRRALLDQKTVFKTV
jgi:hypothetical protein